MLSRRSLLKIATLMILFQGLLSQLEAFDPAPEHLIVDDTFPAHPPELVRKMVIVSHFDLHEAGQRDVATILEAKRLVEVPK